MAAPSESRADAVLSWNAALLDATRATSALLVNGPPEVAREMAMVDIAMFDAVNAATGLAYHPYAYSGPVAKGASADAAALSAGYQVMTSIFASPLWQMTPPAGSPAIAAGVLTNINATYAAGLAGLNLGDPNVVAGLAVGQSAANAIIAKRSTDGSAAAIVKGLIPQAPPGSGTVPGVYVPPSARPEMFPQWGSVTPFGTTPSALASYQSQLPVVQTLASGGLANFIQSKDYAGAVLATQCLGSLAPLAGAVAGACGSAGFAPRTPAQTDAALFWNDPGTTMQPPGHWLQIANTVMSQPDHQLSELQEARLSALLSMAVADAGIGTWDIKYQENLWRPITAIHDCSGWNGFFTTCDPDWGSVIATPPHPDYVAGHPAFSGAAAAVLAAFFGTDDIPFCSTSDPYVNGDQGLVPAITECFDGFSDASSGPNGAALSRVWGGIHTPFAVEDGLQLGKLIGTDVFAHNLRLVPEPGSALLLVSGLAGLALCRRSQITH